MFKEVGSIEICTRSGQWTLYRNFTVIQSYSLIIKSVALAQPTIFITRRTALNYTLYYRNYPTLMLPHLWVWCMVCVGYTQNFHAHRSKQQTVTDSFEVIGCDEEQLVFIRVYHVCYSRMCSRDLDHICYRHMYTTQVGASMNFVQDFCSVRAISKTRFFANNNNSWKKLV